MLLPILGTERLHPLIMQSKDPINLYMASTVRVTLYHTSQILTTLREKRFETLWEKEKMLVACIFPFPTMFSTLSWTDFVVSAAITHSLIHHFQTVPN